MPDQPATTAHPLLAAAHDLLPDVIEVRRRLHRVPEVGLHLPLTQAIVATELRAIGLEPRFGVSTTSITAIIEGARPGPAILLRADMDGLPLHEDTGLPFASEHADAMHACGHDTHVAMLLGAARLLAERRDQLAGRVLLMFQPGEEGFHGARCMLDEGLLQDGPHGTAGVERAVAIHISTRYPSGVIGLRPNALLASSDTITAVVRGRGGHASAPHLAVDPITAAAELVIALQTAVTRSVDVFDPAVLTIGRIAGGTTNNIIPDSVEIEGTFRCVSAATRELMRGLVERVAAGVAATSGTTIELEITRGYPVTVCDPEITGWIAALAEDLVGTDAVDHFEQPIMGAEDFSYVTERVPGMMAFLGACLPGTDPAAAPMNHSNLVVFHEDAMATGVALYAAAALDYLSGR
jgi:hippurate hydrolase